MKNRLAENNHQINNFDKVLDKLFGVEGSQQRAEAEKNAQKEGIISIEKTEIIGIENQTFIL